LPTRQKEKKGGKGGRKDLRLVYGDVMNEDSVNWNRVSLNHLTYAYEPDLVNNTTYCNKSKRHLTLLLCYNRNKGRGS
jgi:hypothetical protein